MDDTGLVHHRSCWGEAMERARQMIQALTRSRSSARPTKARSEHAASDVLRDHAWNEGLVHISDSARPHREDRGRRQEGRPRQVKLLERDERGRLRLSMKALVAKPEVEFATVGAGADQPMAVHQPKAEPAASMRGRRTVRASTV